ncbi:hypothetical protein SARC_12543, partial [Sphaeroforma arctica JP610]
RRQQHLNPIRRKEDDIDRRGTKRRQSNLDRTSPHTGQVLEGQQQARLEAHHPVSATDKQSPTAHEDKPAHSGDDVVFEGETKRVPDLRADRSQTIPDASAVKLTELMAQQQSLLERYEQRLQRTTTDRLTTLLAATETSTGTHKRVHTSPGNEDNPTFRIHGRTRPHLHSGMNHQGRRANRPRRRKLCLLLRRPHHSKSSHVKKCSRE